jgi:copper(I)-binding protein
MTLEISRPWARSATTAKGTTAKTLGGGFFTVENKGSQSDRLVAASTPAAEQVEIHAIRVVGPDIKMRPLGGGLLVPPRTTITLQPRGYHLLMTGLKAPLVKGAKVPLVLTFEKAGTRAVEMDVQAPGLVGEDALDDTR